MHFRIVHQFGRRCRFDQGLNGAIFQFLGSQYRSLEQLTLVTVISKNSLISLMIYILKHRMQHLLLWNNELPQIRKHPHNRPLSPTPCQLVNRYWHFVGAYCVHLQGTGTLFLGWNTLKNEAVRFFETPGTVYQSTRHNIPEHLDSHTNNHKQSPATVFLWFLQLDDREPGYCSQCKGWLRDRRSGVRIPATGRYFLNFKTVWARCGVHSTSYSMGIGVLPPGVKLQERKVDHSACCWG